MEDTISHLDKTGNYVRLLFINDRLVTKLRDLGLNTSLFIWIPVLQTSRHKTVRVGGHTSSILILNTGAPQGCILSPLL